MKDACIVIKFGYSRVLLGIVEWTVSIYSTTAFLCSRLNRSSAISFPLSIAARQEIIWQLEVVGSSVHRNHVWKLEKRGRNVAWRPEVHLEL